MNVNDRPTQAAAAASHFANPTSGSTEAAPTNTSTNTTIINTPSRIGHHCDLDGCAFNSDTARGVKEHQKNKHLGTECYWKFSDDELCGHTTETHEGLYNHFNGVHLKRDGQEEGPYQCCWPGFPGAVMPDGSRIGAEKRCEKTFQKLGSAERHAREHQHNIWRRMEEVVFEPQDKPNE